MISLRRGQCCSFNLLLFSFCGLWNYLKGMLQLRSSIDTYDTECSMPYGWDSKRHWTLEFTYSLGSHFTQGGVIQHSGRMTGSHWSLGWNDWGLFAPRDEWLGGHWKGGVTHPHDTSSAFLNFELAMLMSLYIARAGGNGTAGTVMAGMVMAVPILREKNGVAWVLTYVYIIELPLRAVRHSLGRLRGLLQTFQVFKHPKYRRENWGSSIFYGDTWAWDEHTNWGGANMGVMHSGHFWQLGSVTSLATETTGGEVLVAFWPKHGLRNDRRVPGGTCPQTPLAYSNLSAHNSRTSLK